MKKFIFALAILFFTISSVYSQDITLKLFTDKISILNNETQQITAFEREINVTISNHRISFNDGEPIIMISEPVLINNDKNNFYVYASAVGTVCRCWFREVGDTVRIAVEFSDCTFIYNCIIVK